MPTQSNAYTSKILPPQPANRNEFADHFKTVLEEIISALDIVEKEMPKQRNPLAKVFNQPPKNWRYLTISAIDKISRHTNKAQNSLNRLKEIWPEGVLATDFYQNFLNQFSDWRKVISEIASYEWNYFNQAERDRFNQLSTLDRAAASAMDNDIAGFSDMYQKIVKDLEPFGLRDWFK